MFLTESEKTWVRLRQQAHFWRAQHARVVVREAAWKTKSQQLETIVSSQKVQLKELSKQVEELKSQVVWLKQQLFGRKTEQSEETDADICGDDQNGSDSSDEKRSRGKQQGAKGSGRKLRTNLPIKDLFHDVPEDQKRCPKCGKSRRLFSTTEDSEEIHIETRLVRIIHKRKKYSSTCNCKDVPSIVTAPPPPKLIPRGMFSVDFWTHILLEKFLFQRPTSRILRTLKLEGLSVSQGTITGGLKKIKEMVYPLYTRILEQSRNSNHWHMDETRWMMFVTVNGTTGYRWWLWVVVTKQTVVYILDPSRSAQVPKDHLGENPRGIISADRYSSYKTLLNKHLLIAYCWGHVRRDYVRIHDTRKTLRLWAKKWIKGIDLLFYLNNKRLEVLSEPDKFSKADLALRDALDSMKQNYEHELTGEDLHPLKRKALKSLRDHWSGLLIFVDHPEIPMDNNLSERKLREPVLGRKNYYGCSSLWSGALAAALFTIFQTVILNHIHPKKFLRAYLEACAQNHGKPPDHIDEFLPWNLSKKQKLAWKYPEAPP